MKYIASLLLIVLALAAQAQTGPVKWNYGVTHLSDSTYELKVVATIENGWHIYAQTQPKDAVCFATLFTMNGQKLTKYGRLKELGEAEIVQIPELGISQVQYEHRVEFTQVLLNWSREPVKVPYSVEFQACTDEQCLPPTKLSFEITLGK